jgi:hypothetical protein
MVISMLDQTYAGLEMLDQQDESETISPKLSCASRRSTLSSHAARALLLYAA